MDTSVRYPPREILVAPQGNSAPVHKGKTLWITYIAIYRYEVVGNSTPCDQFGVLLFTELNYFKSIQFHFQKLILTSGTIL